MYLNRHNIFGGGWKKSSINHINLVNLNNPLQHLSLGTLAIVTDIFSSSWNCSAVSSSCPLPSLLSIVLFSPAQRNAVRKHADVLLLFSAAKIQFFSQIHQFCRGKASKTDIRTVLQRRVTICLPLSSSSSKEGRKKCSRGLALHYLLALTFMRFPAGFFLLTRQDEHPQKLARRWLLTHFHKLALFQVDSVSLVSNQEKIWFCFPLKNRKGK